MTSIFFAIPKVSTGEIGTLAEHAHYIINPWLQLMTGVKKNNISSEAQTNMINSERTTLASTIMPCYDTAPPLCLHESHLIFKPFFLFFFNPAERIKTLFRRSIKLGAVQGWEETIKIISERSKLVKAKKGGGSRCWQWLTGSEWYSCGSFLINCMRPWVKNISPPWGFGEGKTPV